MWERLRTSVADQTGWHLTTHDLKNDSAVQSF